MNINTKEDERRLRCLLTEQIFTLLRARLDLTLITNGCLNYSAKKRPSRPRAVLYHACRRPGILANPAIGRLARL